MLIVLHQVFGDNFGGVPIEVVGTDLSTDILAQARAGMFTPYAVAQTPPDVVKRYFTQKDETTFEFDRKLLANVRFHQHNLMDRLPTSVPFDAIFVRNVMIYFDQESRQKVLQHCFQSLRPEGLLVVGESESLLSVEHPFEYLKPSIFKKPATGEPGEEGDPDEQGSARPLASGPQPAPHHGSPSPRRPAGPKPGTRRAKECPRGAGRRWNRREHSVACADGPRFSQTTAAARAAVSASQSPDSTKSSPSACSDGALQTLREQGVADDDVVVTWVPGAFELPSACQLLAKTGNYDAADHAGRDRARRHRPLRLRLQRRDRWRHAGATRHRRADRLRRPDLWHDGTRPWRGPVATPATRVAMPRWRPWRWPTSRPGSPESVATRLACALRGARTGCPHPPTARSHWRAGRVTASRS